MEDAGNGSFWGVDRSHNHHIPCLIAASNTQIHPGTDYWELNIMINSRSMSDQYYHLWVISVSKKINVLGYKSRFKLGLLSYLMVNVLINNRSILDQYYPWIAYLSTF